MKRIISWALVMALLLGMMPAALASEAEHYGFVENLGDSYQITEGAAAQELFAELSTESRAFSRAVVNPPYDVLGITKKSYASTPAFKNINQVGEYFLYHLLRETWKGKFTYPRQLSNSEMVQILDMCSAYFPTMISVSYKWSRKSGSSTYNYEITLSIDKECWAVEKKYATKFVNSTAPTVSTEKDYLLAAHDKIAKLAVYDITPFNMSTQQRLNYYGHNHSQLAYCVLQCRNSVCSGYANLFSLLGLSAGINVASVVGYAGEAHRWNWVFTQGGESVLVDVTWDDTYYSSTGSSNKQIVHIYFWNKNLYAGGRSTTTATTDFINYLNGWK